MVQADLVRATGLSRNLISGLVNDTMTNTSTDTIIRIAKALRISPAYFFEEHAYTPLEILDLPDEVKKFILNLGNMDYLIFAEEISKKNLPLEDVKKFLALYEEVMNKK